MSNTAIQQSLIDIEQNLRKLESARSQVDNIADKSERLIVSIASVIESIDTIRESFDSDEGYLANSIQNSLDEFQASLKKHSKETQTQTVDLNKKQEKSINNNINKIEEFQQKLKDDFYTKFNNSFNVFKESLDKSSDEAQKKSEDLLNIQEKVSENNILKLQEFQSELMKLQDVFLGFDLEKNLEGIYTEISRVTETVNMNEQNTAKTLIEIQSQIEAAKKSQSQAAKKNLIILATGFVITFVIIFIF